MRGLLHQLPANAARPAAFCSASRNVRPGSLTHATRRTSRGVLRVRAAGEDLQRQRELEIERETAELLDSLKFQSAVQAAAPPKRMASAGLSAGDVIGGKYTIQSTLGQGSNATTYQATAPDGTAVAVKALGLRGAGGWKQLELFQREAQTLKGLAHPGIPRYLEYFEEDSDTDRSFYLVQELVDGRSLADIALEGVRPDEAEVERIGREILKVLEYLSSLRPPVVHRDVKPENIVLQGGRWGGRVYLVDFGGVQAMAAPVGKEGMPLGSTVIGTYGYMAPEQFQGAAQPSSDVYALAGTLLFLLSGQPPSAFPQERMRVSWKGQVTAGPRLQQVLDGCLEPVAEDRFSATDALAALDGKALANRNNFAAVKAKRQGALAARPPAGRIAQPKGTRVSITSTPTRIEIDVPPAGLTGNTMATGTFAIAWNAFVAFWTISAAASGALLMALFSAPFWWAGAQLMGQTVAAGLLRERLEIGRGSFRVVKELAMLEGKSPKFLVRSLGGDKAREGSSSQLLGARVVTLAIVNGEPRTAIEVMEGVDVISFGEGLQTVEQEWVAGEINAWLAETRGTEVDLEAMPPPKEPKVFWDNDRPFGDGDRDRDMDRFMNDRPFGDDSLESRFRK